MSVYERLGRAAGGVVGLPVWSPEQCRQFSEEGKEAGDTEELTARQLLRDQRD